MVDVVDVRIKISPEMIRKYRGPKGIDRTWIPIDKSQNIYDLRMTASQEVPVEQERRYKEDLERELERFRIIGDRIRDSPLFVKSFDKRKVSMQFQTHIDNKQLDSIDHVRSKAKPAEDTKDPNWVEYRESN